MNDTGIVPVEYRCVVRLDPVEKKTKGGVFIPDEYYDREQMNAVEGTLLATGGNAFEGWNAPIPESGDRVMINKYAGIVRDADSNAQVRVVNDKDVIAVLKEATT